MSLDRKTFKTALAVISALVLSVFISGCAIPVCCAPNHEESQFQLMHLDAQKRQDVIELFLEYQSQQDFNKIASLFSKDIRDKFTRSNTQLKRKKSPAELGSYMRDMRKFVFISEKETTHKNTKMWVLSYQHTERKHQFLIYYLMKEGRAYKIFDQRPLNKY